MSILRDQDRARKAYTSVAAVPRKDFDDYRIAVNAFGAQVIRLGLCAAIAWLQRAKTDGADLFLQHLNEANLRGLDAIQQNRGPAVSFASKVQAADAANYMIATRDTLALVVWFRRALQASRTGTAEVAVR